MQWRWFIWSFIPGLNWMAWIQAGILANCSQYYWVSLAYASPLFLFLLTKRLSYRLVILSWLIGLAHAHISRREINQRIVDATGSSC
jgi:hypothetical protein